MTTTTTKVTTTTATTASKTNVETAAAAASTTNKATAPNNTDFPRTWPRLPAWKVILKMVQYRKDLWLANLLMMIITMLFYQIPGLAIREFFNLLTGNAQLGLNVWSIIGLLFAAEIGSILGIFGLVTTNVPFFMNTMTLLRKNLLRHILRRPGASALPDSPGEAISRFRGDVFEIPLFSLWLNDIMGSVAFNVIALIIMVRISPTYTGLALLPLLVAGVIAAASTKRIDEYRRASSRATGIITGFIGEFFGAVQAVKVATAEEGVIGRFNELNNERRVLALRDRLFNEILNSIFHNASNLSTGVILILAGRAMQAGTFTVGDFALFVYYLEFLSDMTAFSGLVIARYRQIGISIERMQRLMQGANPAALVEFSPVYMNGKFPAVTYPKKKPENILRQVVARNLTYHFPGSDNGIQNINLSLPRGSFTVVTGRIGSGKTTLLRVLLGLLPKDDGLIFWNGGMVDKPGEFFTPPNCAYTGQVPRLFSDTLRDNILMGLDRTDEDIFQAVRTAVMERDLGEFDEGLDTKVGPKGVKLSGGQIQRTAAARMFVRGADLLVFDDLSSALDVETERILWERVFAKSGDGEDGRLLATASISARPPVCLARPAWWSRTAGRLYDAPITSSC